MTDSARIGDRTIRFDASSGVSIAIPMTFTGAQPNVYGVEYASSRTVRTESFTGDVSRGGTCNVSRLMVIPHCNGTHTECVGHVTAEPIAVSDVLAPGLLAASVVTIAPVDGGSTEDDSEPPIDANDRVIDAAGVEGALAGCDAGYLEALVIRTTPNDPSKTERHYTDNQAPYLTQDAMRRIVDTGVEHLLVDLPSVDRLIDGGAMAAHRLFWNVEGTPRHSESGKTITELVYVPDFIADGAWILDLQIPALKTDAVPSRPVLYRIDGER